MAALGAPPGVVTGEGVSLANRASRAGAFAVAGRILGGGGRRLGELAWALGGDGRMLGGGGRERPRTGGGGGVPGGRERGAPLLLGRGGSDTGRGGETEGVTVGAIPDAGVALAVAARFSLSLALPCSLPMSSPSSRALTSIARPNKKNVRERPHAKQFF
jgi:hypothetical protein